MAKDKEASVSTFRELFQPGVYKRNQGRIARQATFAAIALTWAIGCWRLSVFFEALQYRLELSYGIPGLLLLIGLWLSYRLVNIPKFADFLIAVEAEMNKVSWPTQTELFRACVVVIFTIFFLTAVLFIYDSFWQALLSALGVLWKAPAPQ